jgi:hypothetical protein
VRRIRTSVFGRSISPRFFSEGETEAGAARAPPQAGGGALARPPRRSKGQSLPGSRKEPHAALPANGIDRSADRTIH